MVLYSDMRSLCYHCQTAGEAGKCLCQPCWLCYGEEVAAKAVLSQPCEILCSGNEGLLDMFLMFSDTTDYQ